MLIRLLKRFVLMNAVEDGGGGGAVAEAPAAEAPAAEPAKPASMLDAISRAVDGPEQAEPQAEQPTDAPAGQPRDQQGRFAKTDTPSAASATGQPGAAPQGAQPKAEPEKPEDLTQMPEGLQPKAQQRFQKLVEQAKQADERATQAEAQVNYIREQFQTHGVNREQFEGATQYIGLVNRGDLRGARDLLLEQLRELSIAIGEPIRAPDALAEFGDLRTRVDSGSIGEEDAMVVARARRAEQLAQQQAEQQRAGLQAEQQRLAAVQQGQQAVDAWARKTMAEDMDYAALEERLLPEIPNLIKGLPPQAWPNVIETHYRLLKRAMGSVRSQAPAGPVLRPTGPASPAARPRSAYEAMWGAQAPA